MTSAPKPSSGRRRSANGVGLAAPQVAVDVQLAVIDVSHNPDCITYMKINGEKVNIPEHMPIVFTNPQLELGSDKAIAEEGCLSFPRLLRDVRRSKQIKVTYTDLEGQTVTVETDGLLARAFQHEIDHLKGILFIDRLNAVAKVSLKRKLERLMQEWEEDDEDSQPVGGIRESEVCEAVPGPAPPQMKRKKARALDD